MMIHQVLVSRDLGGAGLIALRVAHELRRQARPVLVWIPGSGAAEEEAHSLGLTVAHYDPALLSGRRTAWQTARGNLGIFRALLRTGPDSSMFTRPMSTARSSRL